MPFKAEDLLRYDIPEVRQKLTPESCILYALGIGLGSDPMDPRELRYVYEDGLAAFPTMTAVLGYGGFWAKRPDTGIDWVRVLHGEQSIEIKGPLPTTGEVRAKTRVVGITDKGPGKGALILNERDVIDCSSGIVVATVASLTFARGDGGCGSAGRTSALIPKVPERTADARLAIATPPQLALIYRLSGDFNPLHADPAVARKAGFERPILHGLATYGVAARAILALAGDMRPDALRSMRCRFTAPVYPGETLETEIWRQGGELLYRVSLPDRQAIVVAHGSAVIG